MAFGEGRDDAALRAAWRLFCERLQAAGDRVFKDFNPPAPLHRADAFRFLTQNLGQAFDLGLETKDTRYPVLHAFVTPYCKLGGDCADFVYQQAWIDGNSVYKISGNRGTARFLNFTVQGPRPENAAGYQLAEPARAFRRHSRGEPVRTSAGDAMGRELRALHRRPKARAQLAAHDARLAQAVPAPGLRPLERVACPHAHRARRHDRAAARAHARGHDARDRLGRSVRDRPHERLAGSSLPIQRQRRRSGQHQQVPAGSQGRCRFRPAPRPRRRAHVLAARSG